MDRGNHYEAAFEAYLQEHASVTSPWTRRAAILGEFDQRPRFHRLRRSPARVSWWT